MARTYDRTTPSYISTGSIVVSQLPVTFCAILRRPTAAGTYDVLGEVLDTNRWFQLRAAKSAGGVMTWQYMGKASFMSTFTATWSPGTAGAGEWVMIQGVSETSTSHKLYVNGTLRSTSTASCNPNVSSGNTYIGRSRVGGLGYLGTIGTVAIWDAALTADEIAGMYAREGVTARMSFVAPWLVRPESLQGCWPCMAGSSPEANLAGSSYAMALTGSPPRADGGPLAWYGSPIAA